MFEVLESIPAYSGKTQITREAYNEAVTSFTKHLKRAFERFEAYWRTGNTALFDMSLDELLKASSWMDVVMSAVADEKVVDKVSHRATFMYDLAACMMGEKS